MFIARHLEKLPEIAAAFDAGEIPWTKVREILKVATPETQRGWLDTAKELSNRELEKLVRRKAPSEEFVTLRISLPEGAMNLWVECERIAERDAECELEPWQVLEQMMAEYLSTYGASMRELFSARQETDDEKGIPTEMRQQVVERDDAQCRYPGCSMRAQLGLHHIQFRSRGGDHSPENLITLCAAHHTLIHQHICAVEGEAPNELRWKGPFLDKWSGDNKSTGGKETLETHRSNTGNDDVKFEPSSESDPEIDEIHDNDEDWRAEEVAAIFDRPSLPREKDDLMLPSSEITDECCD